MKFYSESFPLSSEALFERFSDPRFVTDGAAFPEDDKNGRPSFSVKVRKGFCILTCKMVGGATQDNGFLVGSFFIGRIRKTAEGSSLRGVIATAPVYHAVLLGFVVYSMVKAFAAGGFTVLPLCILAFDLFLFAKEFRKQALLLRYLRVFTKKNERR